MYPALERSCDVLCGLNAALGRAGEAWRARVRGVWVRGRLGRVLCRASWFAQWRMLAIMAKASMTRIMRGCQPCQERVSLW